MAGSRDLGHQPAVFPQHQKQRWLGASTGLARARPRGLQRIPPFAFVMPESGA
ncbi:MAG TPA: hypothetical protein VGK14_11750 [Novimethylophilus sp.]|uniref:hypothetical protein n=1 Tax=Novimethylophilus sp. TaxID=2137426 RepID=UPI002F3FEEA2